MTKILITGTGGFVGSSLLKRLQAIHMDTGFIGLKRADLDLADAAAVRFYLEKYRPYRIVHLAASLARGEDEASRVKQWRDTFEAGRNLLDAAVAVKVPHLLIAGTVDELREQDGVLSPDLPAQPRSTYGLCKSLLREKAQFHARCAAMRIDWFRPFKVYGPGQVGTMLIPYAFQMARAGGPADFTDGMQQRDFLYIDDLLDWLVLALQINVARLTHGEFHLHHLGSGVRTPVREILRAIAAEFPGAKFNLGVRPRYPHEPAVQIAPPYASPDPPLSHWSPTTSWRDGIAKTAAWWRAEGCGC